jgi:tetratricopeptide (TPR) repeat protein/transcriptional regulator with XRE-family HTH domain
MSNMDVHSFGDLLTTLRKQHRVSQNELATKLDVHRNTIGKWERGICLPESRTLVLELAKQLRLNDQETRQLLEASLTAPSPHWLMPYQRNPFFTGRENVLQQLHTVLTHERSAVISQSYALSGLGGIGKTQTAIEYAYSYANEYASVFWISAETNESIVSSFVAIAELLNLPEKQEKEQTRVISAVTHWLTSHNDWLVIFDNVEDLELVKGVLPPARCGSLLFTSRRQALGFAAQTLDMEQMTPEEGIRFLLHRARLLDPTAALDSLTAEDLAFAREIVAAMDGLPLALDQAGAYIEETQCGMEHYLQIYQQRRLKVLGRRGYGDLNHPASVVTTLSLSFQYVEQKSPLAACILRLCAFLAPDAIPEELIFQGCLHLDLPLQTLSDDPWLFDETIALLRSSSLVSRTSGTKTLTVHHLTQVVLQETMPVQEQAEWNLRILVALNALFPAEKDVSLWNQCERLVVHVLQCANRARSLEQANEELAALLFKTGRYLVERGRYAEAEPMLKRSVQIWEQRLGNEHILIVSSLSALGKMYNQQGRYNDAERLFRRAIGIVEQVRGIIHFDLIYPLNVLGSIYKEQGKYEEAEVAYRRAVQIGKQGTEYLRLAPPFNGLGNLYLQQGRYEEAEAAYKQSIQIWEQEHGVDYFELAHPLSNLACLYLEQGKYEETERLLKRALYIREQILGKEHPLVAFLLNGLAALYYRQGRYEEAEPLLKRVMSIWEQVSGEMYPNLAYPLSTLGSIYQERGNYEEAEEVYLRAMNIRELQLGNEHPDLAILLIKRGSVYYEQGKYEEAEPMLQRALFLYQQCLSPQHPDIAETLHHFARFHELQQHVTEALSFYQQALTIREQALGLHHPKTNTTRVAYTHLLQEHGRIEEAETIEAQAQLSISSSPVAHAVDHV